MNRSDFQSLSRLRIRESRVLLTNGYYMGSYYLAGYAIECALKACICRQFRRFDFPDKKLVNTSYTHDLEMLLKNAGIQKEFDAEINRSRPFALNWNVIKDWSEEVRYNKSLSKSKAQDYYSSCTARTNGVLSWLKKRW